MWTPYIRAELQMLIRVRTTGVLCHLKYPMILSTHASHFSTCQVYTSRGSARTILVLISKQTLVISSPYITYRVSQEEWTKLRESVPYVELCRYNPKHLYPKLNGYGDNGHRKVWASGVSTYCTSSVTPYSSTAHPRQQDTTS